MASSNTPSVPLRRRGTRARTAVLFVAGLLFDTVALINVPVAVRFSPGAEGEPTLTNIGTGLFLLVVTAWVTVFWRRRVPLLPLIAGGLLAIIGVSYVLLLVGAVGYVRQRPDRFKSLAYIVSAMVAGFALREAGTSWGAALSWIFTTRQEAQYEPAWIVASFIWAAVSLAAAAGVVMLSRTRAQAVRSDQRAAAEHLRADALNEQMVRQAERARIARDMHDALAHRLSVMSLHAGALEAVSAPGDAGGMARTVREQAHAALQDMRGLIGDLRTGPTQTASAPATMRAIGALVSDLRAARVPVTAYVLIESPERASAMLDGAVYRIVQEATTNAIKHAPGALIDLFLCVDPVDGARIRIVNPLRPHDCHGMPDGGNGLLGIRERATALDGTVWIGEHDDSFIVDVSLPWQERG